MDGNGAAPDRRQDIIEAIEVRTTNALNGQRWKEALRLRGDREKVSGCTKRLRTMEEVTESLWQLSSQAKKMVEKVIFEGTEPINPFGHQEPPAGPFPSPSQHGHYNPKRGSGGYAILIAMGKASRNGTQVLHMDDIIREGQPYSNTDMPTIRSQHGVVIAFGSWEANKTLVKKGLMLRTIRGGYHKHEFRLTELGRQLAEELLDGLEGRGGNEGGAEGGPATPSPAAGAAGASRGRGGRGGGLAAARAAAQRRRAGRGAARGGARAAAAGGGRGAAGGSSAPPPPQSPVSQVRAFGSQAARAAGAPREAAASNGPKTLVERVTEATGADTEAAKEALWSCDGSADDAIALLRRQGHAAAAAAVPVAAGPSGSAPGPSGPPPQTPPPPMTPAEQSRGQHSRRRDSSTPRSIAFGFSGFPMAAAGNDRTPVRAEATLGGAHHGGGSRDYSPHLSTPTNTQRPFASVDLFRGFSSSSDSDDDTGAVARGLQDVIDLADSGSEPEGGEEEVLQVLSEPLTLRRPNNGKRPRAEESSSPGAAAPSSISHHGKRPKGFCPEPSEDCVIDLCADQGHPPARASSREPESTQAEDDGFIDLT